MIDTLEYQAFKRREDERQCQLREEAKKRADIAFNRGVWDSLPWYAKWKFPLLGRFNGRHED